MVLRQAGRTYKARVGFEPYYHWFGADETQYIEENIVCTLQQWRGDALLRNKRNKNQAGVDEAKLH